MKLKFQSHFKFKKRKKLKMKTIFKVSKYTLFFAFVVCLVGIVYFCISESFKPVTLVKTESVGVLVSAEVIPTSFNESSKMQIKTGEYVFVTHIIAGVKLNQEVFKNTYSDGSTCLLVSYDKCVSIFGK